MATYKATHTTFLVRKIPVELWKNCRTKAIETDEDQMGDVILKLLMLVRTCQQNVLYK